jgi:DnaK suppressor protein
MTLNTRQHAELAKLLEQRVSELKDTVERFREALAAPGEGNSGAEVRDSAEAGDAAMMSTMDVNQLRRTEDELREALAARQRMHDGVYGLCADCDTPIPFERLRVLPEARYCVPDEERREKELAHGTGR